MNFTKEQKRLVDIYPHVAILTFTDKKYKQYIELRWKLITLYHNKQLLTIYNCMTGGHYYKGKHFTIK